MEKTGDKLVDLLHQSDTWNNLDCERPDFLPCSSAGEKDKKGQCKKKSVVYETYCLTCMDNEEESALGAEEMEPQALEEGKIGVAVKSIKIGEKIPSEAEEVELQILEDNLKVVKRKLDGNNPLEAEEKELKFPEDNMKEVKRKADGNSSEVGESELHVLEEKKKEVKRNMRKEIKCKYIGETHRTAYERGKEHIRDLKDFDEGSHLLKHYLKKHRNIKIEDMKIGMKVRAQYRTVLERQVGEATSILIDQRKGIDLLNSKSEFNRCTLPRLVSGNPREILKNAKNDEEEEKEIEAEIREMKRKKQKEKKKEKEKKRKMDSLLNVCEEMEKENRNKWTIRKMDNVLERKRKEKEEEKLERLEKEKRER